MKRLLTQQLIDWKQKPKRKPLLLDGARQVGKSFLIEHEFGQQNFSRVLKLDFLANPGLAQLLPILVSLNTHSGSFEHPEPLTHCPL